MSITVADCLKLPSLHKARVVAGVAGLDQLVVSVSVLEYAVPAALDRQYFCSNEVIISGLISIKDDVEAQCQAIRRCSDLGVAALIIYYVGIFVPKLDARLLATADELGFPLICMPENNSDLRYSETICDIMEAIFKDRMQQSYFVGEFLERISLLPSRQQTMDTILRLLSDRMRSTFILTDRLFNMLGIASWPHDDFNYTSEVLNYCKMNLKDHLRATMVPMKTGSHEMYLNCQPVSLEQSVGIYLIVVNSTGEITTDFCRQGAEIVRLFINIWSKDEGNMGASELIRAILNDEPIKMRRLAKILNVDVSGIDTMWVLKQNIVAIKHAEKEDMQTKLLVAVKNYLEQHRRNCIVSIFEDKIVAFMNSPGYTKGTKSLAETFIEECGTQLGSISIVLCEQLESTANVRKAYSLAGEHIKHAFVLFPERKILNLAEIQFVAECYEIILRGEASIQNTLLPLKPLLDDDSNEELVRTLSVYLIDADNSIAKTGQLIYVHKNTAKYRIKKIDERLGYSVSKMPESYKLYMACAVKRLLIGIKTEV